MPDDLLDLLKTASAPPMRIDAYAAMAAGRRAQLHQRTRAVVAAALVVLAIVTGAVFVKGKDAALPAGPSSTSPTHTAPSLTPFARSFTAQLAVESGSLTAVLNRDGTTIDVRRSGDSGSGHGLAIPVLTSPGAANCRVISGLQLQACAVFAPVRAGIMTYNEDAVLEEHPGVPAVGRFAVPDVSVVVAGNATFDLSPLAVAWELDDGTVAVSSGALVPQAHGSRVSAAVFALQASGGAFLGIKRDGAERWVVYPPSISSDGAQRTEAGGQENGDYYFGYLLPADAVSFEVVARSGRVVSQETVMLGGRPVLLAHLTGVGPHAHPEAHWVDGSGVTHTIAG